MHRRLSLSLAILLLAAVAVALLGLSLSSGSVPLSLRDVVGALWSDAPTLARDVVLE